MRKPCPVAGGTLVTISGEGFTDVTAVSFGGTPAASFTVIDDTTIEATSPAHSAGTVDVILTNDAGDSDPSSVSLFTYQEGGSGGASVGKLVWEDLDADGLQDADESGVSGVVVNLLDEFGGWLASATTNPFGYYQFNTLDAGNYQLQFVAPAGFLFTLQDQGSNDSVDSDADATGTTAVFSLSLNETRTDLDAGLVLEGDGGGPGDDPGGDDDPSDDDPGGDDPGGDDPGEGEASVGDFVWYDQDGDGIQDPGEPGIFNMVVNLRDATGGWLASTTTDADGYYEFTGLAAGSYRLQFLRTAFWNYTLLDQGSDDGLDSDAGTDGYTAVFSLDALEVETSLDAGFTFSDAGDPDQASVGGRVWQDTDGDGVQGAGEIGVAGVTVELLSEFGVLLATATTDANGNYVFAGLTQGNYRLRFVAPTGYEFTAQNQGGDDGLDSDAGMDGLTDVFALNFGEDTSNVDAGLI